MYGGFILAGICILFMIYQIIKSEPSIVIRPELKKYWVQYTIIFRGDEGKGEDNDDKETIQGDVFTIDISYSCFTIERNLRQAVVDRMTAHYGNDAIFAKVLLVIPL